MKKYNYSYEKTVYTGIFNEITVTCPKHGDFRIKPTKHLSGHKCKQCELEDKSEKFRSSTEQFIEKCKKQFGDIYDYSVTVYGKNARDTILVKCPNCGVIETTPSKFLYSKIGCHKCKRDKLIDFNLETEYNGNYREEYVKLIKNAKLNLVKDGEVHHILPKSMFPLWKNKPSNLVKLSFQDHYKAHYLLWKIYNNKEMALAFKFMLNVTGKEYNPSLYKELKKFGRKVYCYELNKEYDYMKLAAKENNLKSVNGISRACKDWKYKSANYHWCYLEDKEKAIQFWRENGNK